VNQYRQNWDIGKGFRFYLQIVKLIERGLTPAGALHTFAKA